MVYRIRYIKHKGQGREGTETVEANSPYEAMVKFNLRRDRGLFCPPEDTVTSVCPEEPILNSQW